MLPFSINPDGNSWLLQEITERFPGRVEGAKPHTLPPATSRPHCAASPSPMASTRNGPASTMRIGWNGMPPIWPRSRAASRCRPEQRSQVPWPTPAGGDMYGRSPGIRAIRRPVVISSAIS
jgi:hypothetical protein